VHSNFFLQKSRKFTIQQLLLKYVNFLDAHANSKMKALKTQYKFDSPHPKSPCVKVDPEKTLSNGAGGKGGRGLTTRQKGT
jgi:hypothetical protein